MDPDTISSARAVEPSAEHDADERVARRDALRALAALIGEEVFY